MKKKALIVCTENPYTGACGGYERLIVDYQAHVFSDYDVYFLWMSDASARPLGLFHDGELVCDGLTAEWLKQGPAFVLFIGFIDEYIKHDLLASLIAQVPSFCFAELHPHEHVPDNYFKGIITHSSSSPHKEVLQLGGSFNPDVFFKRRRSEEFISCVGRIHPIKNQLELAANYKERIYDKYRKPLFLVGAPTPNHLEYYREIERYVDNVSVFSTVQPGDLTAPSSWGTTQQIADICNRSRFFVMASPRESFCLALIEAMACGTTCIVNGHYRGFERDDLRPHVYGNITRKRGSTLDIIERALSSDVRIDGSEWVKKYSLPETKQKLLRFITERL
jgi:glycosyltransferase involved in cell wall biosynthesis